MRIAKHQIAIVVCLFIARFTQPSHAQPEQTRFDHLPLEQGVSHNLVYAIHQDRYGLMWFGTMYGLVKYDGRQYTIYRHDPRDPHSISYNDIIALHEDRQGFLWIGTWGGGLNKFDRTSETFTRYLHDPNDSTSLRHDTVWTILEDSRGTLWVGTEEGLEELLNSEPALTVSTTDKVKFIHHQIPPVNPQRKTPVSIRALCEDSAGRLWIGTFGGGLKCFDRTQPQPMSFKRDPANPKSLNSNFISAIAEDREGNLWIGTLGHGLNKIAHADLAAFPKPATTFLHYQNVPSNSLSLSANDIGVILVDHNDRLWIGTTSGGLNKFDPTTGQFTRYKHDPGDLHTISSNTIVALCEDRARTLWVGSYKGGVDKLDPFQYKFAHFQNEPQNANSLRSNHVRAIQQDRAGNIWVGTFGGGLEEIIVAAQDSTLKFIHHSDDTRKLRSNLITALHEDTTGTLWIGTFDDGLYAWDRTRRHFSHFKNSPRDTNSLSLNNVNTILVDRDDNIWIGTDGGGLNQLDRRTKRFRRYQNEAENSTGLCDNFVHALYEDRHGSIWIGTYRGLDQFDRRTQTFTHYQHHLNDANSLSNNYVYAIYEDQAGTLWVGTSDGLNKFDRARGNFTNYKESEGLPNGVICGILEDEAGKLWISTQKGLTQFDPRAATFRSFDVAGGLQSNMFNVGAFHKNRRGEMFFGGINGFNWFHPAQIKLNPEAPPIILTGLKILGKPQSQGTDLQQLQGLELSPRENFLTFEFAALSYAAPEKNQYAYKLEGLEAAWNYCGTQTTASYSNLKPGRYVFRVKGSNQDGAWNEIGAALLLNITPPFWKTWWFYLAVGGVLVTAVMLLHRMRLRGERRRVVEIERIKNEERLERFKAVEHARLDERERVRKQIAADFHDESGHKLTKISLFCGVLQSKLSPQAWDIGEYVERIMKVAASLHKDMNDFIWSLDPAENTLHDTALKLRDFGEKLFDHTGIQFHLRGMSVELEQIHLAMEARQNLTCIFKEAMNNVLKHTRSECKHVTCEFGRENGHYVIRLLDDGKGFEPNDCELGHGLRNMQKRANAIHGSLEIISRHGEGTIIQFTNAVATPEHDQQNYLSV